MNKLTDILTQLVSAMETAATNLEEIPRVSRAGHEAAIRKAKQELPELRVRYQTELLANVAKSLFVFGDPEAANVFSLLAMDEGAVAVRADDLYIRLADAVSPSLGPQHTFGPTQLNILVSELRSIASDLGIADMPAPQIRGVEVVNSNRDLIRYIRDMVRGSVKDDLNKMYLSRKIAQQAILNGFTGAFLPVVITGAIGQFEDEALATIFSGPIPSVTVRADTVINQAFVHKAFDKAKKKQTKTETKTNQENDNE